MSTTTQAWFIISSRISYVLLCYSGNLLGFGRSLVVAAEVFLPQSPTRRIEGEEVSETIAFVTPNHFYPPKQAVPWKLIRNDREGLNREIAHLHLHAQKLQSLGRFARNRRVTPGPQQPCSGDFNSSGTRTSKWSTACHS